MGVWCISCPRTLFDKTQLVTIELQHVQSVLGCVADQSLYVQISCGLLGLPTELRAPSLAPVVGQNAVATYFSLYFIEDLQSTHSHDRSIVVVARISATPSD